MESFTLYQVNEYIRRVVALNFREPIWVEAEISQCSEARGNYYIDLIDKDETTLQINANAQANLWQSSFRFIKRKIGDVIYELLQEGRSVRLKCKIEFHERYGLKLIVDDIDPNYTFGQIELQRQQIIKKLKDKNLFDANKNTSLPIVTQRLAIITSSRAAGYKDFVAHIKSNPYGYQFHFDVYESSVQGQKVEKDTCQAIDEINKKPKHYYDAVIILRGGGSKLDLSAYDNYNIAVQIARSNTPFIIGIGHETDQSIVDMVSKSSLKTPTAVADFLIEQMLHFESAIINRAQHISALTDRMINQSTHELDLMKQQLWYGLKSKWSQEHQQLDQTSYKLVELANKLIEKEHNALDLISAKVNGADPLAILKKGYAHIMSEGKTINRAAVLKPGQKVQIAFSDDSKTAQIQ